LLQPRRDLMDLLVNQLIEQETIDGSAFRTLVETFERSQSNEVCPV